MVDNMCLESDEHMRSPVVNQVGPETLANYTLPMPTSSTQTGTTAQWTMSSRKWMHFRVDEYVSTYSHLCVQYNWFEIYLSMLDRLKSRL
jgi:hypothetical protein